MRSRGRDSFRAIRRRAVPRRQRSLRPSRRPGSAVAGQRQTDRLAEQFIELAVNMPEQEPQPGQLASSICVSCSSLMAPLLYWATPSKTEIRSIARPSNFPARIGPPLAKIVGMLARIAPRIMPGVILSQLGMQIMASKQCALTMDSTQSAIVHGGCEYFMPLCPIAMPSQMPIVLTERQSPLHGYTA